MEAVAGVANLDLVPEETGEHARMERVLVPGAAGDAVDDVASRAIGAGEGFGGHERLLHCRTRNRGPGGPR